VVPQCNVANATTSVLIQAQPNTRAADLTTQIAAFGTAGYSFQDKDLVTVLTGQNDVFDKFAQVRDPVAPISEAQAVADVEALGAFVATQVNAIANAGARVIVSTIPDLGLTPFGRATAADAALLSHLSDRFNKKMVIGLINDGHKIGLVKLDEQLQIMAKAGSAIATDIACAPTPALPDCSTLTLTTVATTTMPTPPTAATVSSWMWSDDKRLGPAGQSTLGGLAITRATNNPF
jgi:outer membrane lipase/esterase